MSSNLNSDVSTIKAQLFKQMVMFVQQINGKHNTQTFSKNTTSA